MKSRIPISAALLLASAPAAFAQNTSTPSSSAPSPLPVKQVVLFSSGVSYTQREGDVDGGDATVPLLFRTAQINDILKSLVLLDESGRVQPATYAARDPVGRTLQSFAIDVTQPLGRAELLNRLRGAKIEVTTTTDKQTITGQIVGVETRTIRDKEATTATVETLTVLGDAGLQSVKLDDVRTIRLLDERLNREFREALGVLATGADDQRRQVMLKFSGNGRRKVRVGYVTEAPLWKISYRLVLGGTNEGKADPKTASSTKPYLQGWALVENTSDEDWNAVRLSLVSGRPVSFIQDLYQPLYIPRPVVAPDIVASPFPQTHGGDLLNDNRPDAVPASPPALSGVAGRNRGMAGPGGGFGGGGLGGGGGVVNGALGARSEFAAKAAAPESLAFDAAALGASVQAQAEGQSTGELFAYDITTPVSLPRQQAAMIPVIAQEIGGEKVLLYNADSGSRFPLNAVRVRNTTPLHLKGGPITIFDDGVYAGDAKIEDVPPGDNRLVSYAVDLTVEGERQGKGGSSTETSITIQRGVLVVTRRERQTTEYTLKSKAEKPKTVLVEHPFNSEFKLIAPAAAEERARDVYRFAVNVAPGKSEKLTVVTERPIATSFALLDLDINSVAFYANRTDLKPAMKTALVEVVARRRKVQELTAASVAREAEIKSIGEDQDRIRKNMQSLDKASALYKRYVSELDQQETRLQTLRGDAARLRNEAAQAQAELRAYLDKLDIN